MDKNEFLAVLKEALQGEIPDYEIRGHVEYYDSYIMENDGKTEEEKLRQLGDPRLIARTIIDARMSREGGMPYQESYEQQYSEGESQRENSKERVHYKSYTWDGLSWYQKLLALLILLLVVVVLIVIAGFGIQIFFSIVLPVLVIVFAIRLILSIFR